MSDLEHDMLIRLLVVSNRVGVIQVYDTRAAILTQ